MIESGLEARPTVDRVTPHPPQEPEIESLGASDCLDVSTVVLKHPQQRPDQASEPWQREHDDGVSSGERTSRVPP